ncbi:MAG: DUF3285 domain-containing protein [Pseudanabaenaceae cyanobacterium]
MTEPITLKPEPKSQATAATDSPKDGFVKLAMRNMVRKGSTSLTHFGLTIFGVLGLLVLLAAVFN